MRDAHKDKPLARQLRRKLYVKRLRFPEDHPCQNIGSGSDSIRAENIWEWIGTGRAYLGNRVESCGVKTGEMSGEARQCLQSCRLDLEGVRIFEFQVNMRLYSHKVSASLYFHELAVADDNKIWMQVYLSSYGQVILEI